MEKLMEVKENGKKVINPEMKKAWEIFCDGVFHNCGLRQVGVEIIEDAIETMRLLKETDMDVDSIIKRVGRSWDSRISSVILVGAIEKFSLDGKRFAEELNKLQKTKKTKSLDDVLSAKR